MNSITTYLRDLRDIRSSGSAVKETSYYPALTTLLNAIGHDLRPRVHCILTLKNSGSGIPDGGLFTADQIGAQAPSDAFPAQMPARGVLEVKGTADDVTIIAKSPQVQKYLTHYGQVLVTNYRDFLLVGRDAHGHPLPQERYTLAATESEFWTHIGLSSFADLHRERLTEYLRRVLLAAAPLTNPADVAWFLASYARDARARIDPSVFSTEFNPEGIQVGTAIALMVRRPSVGAKHRHPMDVGKSQIESGADASPLHFRNFWGRTKRAQLQDALDDPTTHPYQPLNPPVEIGLPFQPAQVNAEYLTWPLLPDLLPTAFPGVKTSRDDVLVSIDRERLIERMQHYFDPQISHAEMTRIAPRFMESGARFNPTVTRDTLLKRGFLPQNVVRYCYRPFDVRWLYWEPETKLLDEKRSDYFPHVFAGNVWLSAVQQNRKDYDPPLFTSDLASLHIVERGANLFPLSLRTSSQMKLNHAPDLCDLGDGRRLNLSDAAVAYLTRIGSMADAEALFYHSIAILHAPAYRVENAGALRQDWPRVPLSARRDLLLASAELGQQIAALLNSELPVAGVTSGTLREELKTIGILSVIGGGPINLAAGDLDVTAGWGFGGRGGITMPGKGKVTERAITANEENPALGLGAGASTYDIRLNERVCWRNIPPCVWDYTIGGYQVIKKWLSYRERALLGRGLNLDEARAVTQIARRIAAILLREAELDQNYRDVAGETYTTVE